MGTRTNENERDAALWRRFAAASQCHTPAGEPDLNLLAAYLDGSASPAERDAVEDAMVSNPGLVQFLADAREMCFAGPTEVPESIVAQSKMAVSAARERDNATAGQRARSARLAWWFRAAAAAALVIVSVVAYRLGIETSAARRRTEADLASAVAAELRQEQVEHDFLAALGANGRHNKEAD